MQTLASVDTPIIPDGMAHVLIVDDSRAQRLLLATALRRAGYKVSEAASAEEALPLCHDPAIDVVVSDWGMPGMDGPEFCAALRKIDRPYAYFILMTSRADRDERATGLDSGADDFVTRPIDWVELRARIRAGERLLGLHKRMAEANEIVINTLAELQDLHAAVQVDLSEARKLQQSLIPPPSQTLRGCTVASRLVTCGQIGGDLVGHFPISDTRIAVYSIDVSGHGIASALMTGRLSGLFSSQEPERNIAYSRWLDGEIHLDAPHLVATRLNALMLSELDTDIYFTCALAYIDLESGAVEFCQAGHPPPIVQRTDGRVQHHGTGGPPIGLVDGLSFESVSLKLDPGDRLILYSDGLSEAMSRSGEMLGEDGLVCMIGSISEPEPIAMLANLECQLAAFADGREFEDDISMLAVEFTPAA